MAADFSGWVGVRKAGGVWVVDRKVVGRRGAAVDAVAVLPAFGQEWHQGGGSDQKPGWRPSPVPGRTEFSSSRLAVARGLRHIY
jgi:hypothetical protein